MKRLLAAAISALALVTVQTTAGAAQRVPRNDDFDRAKNISALPFAANVNVRRATQADDDPSCRNTGHTVWFKFTPSTDMRLMARVSGPIREWMSVWTGERGALTRVDCGDNRPIFDATGGTTYYFMVGTYHNRRGGDIRFRLAEGPPPPTIEVTVDPEVTVNSQTEEVTVSGTITCDNESEYTEFYGSVKQADGRHFISAFFYEFELECDGTAQPWSATELGDGVFIDGPGLVDVEAYTCSRFECVEDEKVVNVTIERQ